MVEKSLHTHLWRKEEIMANKYPYVASAGPLIKTVDHLRRKKFPEELTTDTLRKIGVAPKNETYVINTLRFLGVIDDEGKKDKEKAEAFVQHKEEEFQKQFERIVRDAYEELFELHGDEAWKLDRASLTQFFRSTDHSTEIVGGRQAGTFMHLAALSGQTELPQAREGSAKKVAKAERAPAPIPAPIKVEKHEIRGEDVSSKQKVGLTVRIEVNLPADGDQETYDNIFRSIRQNLIDAE